MKNFKYFLLIIMGLILVSSCEKGKDLRMPKVVKANSAVFKVNDTLSSPFINVSNVNAYSLTFDVNMLFNHPFKKIEIMVVMDRDFSKQYLLKTITSVPTSVTITGADIVKAIPALASSADIVAGDVFYVFGNVELTDGTYLPGMLSDGKIALASDNINIVGILKNAVPDIRIAVPCAFNPAMAVGSYHAVSKDWGSDGNVTVTADPNDPYKIYVSGFETMEGLVEDKGPLPIFIKKNYSVDIPRHVLVSSLAPWGLSYTNLAYGGSGTFNTCDGSYSLTMQVSVDQGSFGTFHWKLTRN